ncbi:NAD(P)-dependent oxidoreductase [Holzapfeliella sp. JNUCC 72]
MTFRIGCYGVHSYEAPYFENLNKYHYDLKLLPEFLTHDNIDLIEDCDAVLLRGNCIADRQNLAKMAEYGIKLVFTRTVGFDHIDLDAAAEFGMKVTRVPGYSPRSVAELAFTQAMMLFRHTALATNRTSQKQFKVTPDFFSPEIHESTVGIIGMGNIGYAEAKMWKALGARVLAYDLSVKEFSLDTVEKFVSLDELAQECDIISIHAPYVRGKNEKMFSREIINQMKPTGILVNTARGELVDHDAVIDALKENRLGGFAADVLVDESQVFGHNFDPSEKLPNETITELTNLYPKAIITPHMGSLTKPALEGMITTSYENFHLALTENSYPNEVLKK